MTPTLTLSPTEVIAIDERATLSRGPSSTVELRPPGQRDHAEDAPGCSGADAAQTPEWRGPGSNPGVSTLSAALAERLLVLVCTDAVERMAEEESVLVQSKGGE